MVGFDPVPSARAASRSPDSHTLRCLALIGIMVTVVGERGWVPAAPMLRVRFRYFPGS